MKNSNRADYTLLMSLIDVCETFVSIQGESTCAGTPCFFIRLSGCNLRCRYCDTPYAYLPGRAVEVGALVEEAASQWPDRVLITGGEPLMQKAFPELAGALGRTGKRVYVETNGSHDISVIPETVRTIMDVKCPGSGEGASFDAANLSRLRPWDEVKFVLSDRRDFDWAASFVIENHLNHICRAVLFSPIPGKLEANALAKWILDDQIPARLQIQLHKLLGLK